MSGASYPSFSTLEVIRPTAELNNDNSNKDAYILHIILNRPEKMNAMNAAFWKELKECIGVANADPEVRVIVISARGKHFTSGLDISDASLSNVLISGDDTDVARSSYHLRSTIMEMQDSFTCLEECLKPVIAATHGGVIGGGVDMVTACDIRYCTEDTFFCIKEVDIGLAADVGTLQRLPKIVANEGLVRELAYTGRRFSCQEAFQMGLVTRVFPNQKAVIEGAFELARVIVSKSPIAIVGTKRFINHARDHTVREGLEYAATWNMAMLNTADVPVSISGGRKNTLTPNSFSKL